jgi:hypothetical protein
MTFGDPRCHDIRWARTIAPKPDPVTANVARREASEGVYGGRGLTVESND